MRANLHVKTKNRSLGMNCRTFFQNPRTRGRRYNHHHHHCFKPWLQQWAFYHKSIVLLHALVTTNEPFTTGLSLQNLAATISFLPQVYRTASRSGYKTEPFTTGLLFQTLATTTEPFTTGLLLQTLATATEPFTTGLLFQIPATTTEPFATGLLLQTMSLQR